MYQRDGPTPLPQLGRPHLGLARILRWMLAQHLRRRGVRMVRRGVRLARRADELDPPMASGGSATGAPLIRGPRRSF